MNDTTTTKTDAPDTLARFVYETRRDRDAARAKKTDAVNFANALSNESEILKHVKNSCNDADAAKVESARYRVIKRVAKIAIAAAHVATDAAAAAERKADDALHAAVSADLNPSALARTDDWFTNDDAPPAERGFKQTDTAARAYANGYIDATQHVADFVYNAHAAGTPARGADALSALLNREIIRHNAVADTADAPETTS